MNADQAKSLATRRQNTLVKQDSLKGRSSLNPMVRHNMFGHSADGSPVTQEQLDHQLAIQRRADDLRRMEMSQLVDERRRLAKERTRIDLAIKHAKDDDLTDKSKAKLHEEMRSVLEDVALVMDEFVDRHVEPSRDRTPPRTIDVDQVDVRDPASSSHTPNALQPSNSPSLAGE